MARAPRRFTKEFKARVAYHAMRHSRMELTNQYYTHPILLDVAGVVNSLPDFSGSQGARHRMRTGFQPHPLPDRPRDACLRSRRQTTSLFSIWVNS